MAGADGRHDAGATAPEPRRLSHDDATAPGPRRRGPRRRGCNVKIARYLSNDS
ncbi:hypothetical protein HMPREF1868_00521 [Olsenella sp. DNF00959]|nr:hypothetical protein HMPREF1868_00521 [Olsenella sp. DNF00959]